MEATNNALALVTTTSEPTATATMVVPTYSNSNASLVPNSSSSSSSLHNKPPPLLPTINVISKTFESETLVSTRRLQRGTVLSATPSNWLQSTLNGISAPQEAKLGAGDGNDDDDTDALLDLLVPSSSSSSSSNASFLDLIPSLAAALARQNGPIRFDAGTRCINLADFLGQVDVVASAASMKRLFRIMVVPQEGVSLAIHRLGNTLIVDGDVGGSSSSSTSSSTAAASSSSSSFTSAHNTNNTNSASTATTSAEEARVLFSKFLYRSALPDASSDRVLSEYLNATADTTTTTAPEDKRKQEDVETTTNININHSPAPPSPPGIPPAHPTSQTKASDVLPKETINHHNTHIYENRWVLHSAQQSKQAELAPLSSPSTIPTRRGPPHLPPPNHLPSPPPPLPMPPTRNNLSAAARQLLLPPPTLSDVDSPAHGRSLPFSSPSALELEAQLLESKSERKNNVSSSTTPSFPSTRQFRHVSLWQLGGDNNTTSSGVGGGGRSGGGNNSNTISMVLGSDLLAVMFAEDHVDGIQQATASSEEASSSAAASGSRSHVENATSPSSSPPSSPGRKKEKLVSLHLRDANRPVTPSEALDLYLDARLAGVEALAVCWHDHGIVRGYDVVNTGDVLMKLGNGMDGEKMNTTGNINVTSSSSSSSSSTASVPPLNPLVVEAGALTLLTFLRESCSREGSYWLHRHEGDASLRLFDLTGFVSKSNNTTSSNTNTNSSTNMHTSSAAASTNAATNVVSNSRHSNAGISTHTDTASSSSNSTMKNNQYKDSSPRRNNNTTTTTTTTTTTNNNNDSDTDIGPLPLPSSITPRISYKTAVTTASSSTGAIIRSPKHGPKIVEFPPSSYSGLAETSAEFGVVRSALNQHHQQQLQHLPQPAPPSSSTNSISSSNQTPSQVYHAWRTNLVITCLQYAKHVQAKADKIAHTFGLPCRRRRSTNFHRDTETAVGSSSSSSSNYISGNTSMNGNQDAVGAELSLWIHPNTDPTAAMKQCLHLRLLRRRLLLECGELLGSLQQPERGGGGGAASSKEAPEETENHADTPLSSHELRSLQIALHAQLGEACADIAIMIQPKSLDQEQQQQFIKTLSPPGSSSTASKLPLPAAVITKTGSSRTKSKEKRNYRNNTTSNKTESAEQKDSKAAFLKQQQGISLQSQGEAAAAEKADFEARAHALTAWNESAKHHVMAIRLATITPTSAHINASTESTSSPSASGHDAYILYVKLCTASARILSLLQGNDKTIDSHISLSSSTDAVVGVSPSSSSSSSSVRVPRASDVRLCLSVIEDVVRLGFLGGASSSASSSGNATVGNMTNSTATLNTSTLTHDVSAQPQHQPLLKGFALALISSMLGSVFTTWSQIAARQEEEERNSKQFWGTSASSIRETTKKARHRNSNHVDIPLSSSSSSSEEEEDSESFSSSLLGVPHVLKSNVLSTLHDFPNIRNILVLLQEQRDRNESQEAQRSSSFSVTSRQGSTVFGAAELGLSVTLEELSRTSQSTKATGSPNSFSAVRMLHASVLAYDAAAGLFRSTRLPQAHNNKNTSDKATKDAVNSQDRHVVKQGEKEKEEADEADADEMNRHADLDRDVASLFRDVLRQYGSVLVSTGRLHLSPQPPHHHHQQQQQEQRRELIVPPNLPAAITCFSRAVDIFKQCQDVCNEGLARANVSHCMRQLALLSSSSIVSSASTASSTIGVSHSTSKLLPSDIPLAIEKCRCVDDVNGVVVFGGNDNDEWYWLKKIKDSVSAAASVIVKDGISKSIHSESPPVSIPKDIITANGPHIVVSTLNKNVLTFLKKAISSTSDGIASLLPLFLDSRNRGGVPAPAQHSNHRHIYHQALSTLSHLLESTAQSALLLGVQLSQNVSMRYRTTEEGDNRSKNKQDSSRSNDSEVCSDSDNDSDDTADDDAPTALFNIAEVAYHCQQSLTTEMLHSAYYDNDLQPSSSSSLPSSTTSISSSSLVTGISSSTPSSPEKAFLTSKCAKQAAAAVYQTGQHWMRVHAAIESVLVVKEQQPATSTTMMMTSKSSNSITARDRALFYLDKAAIMFSKCPEPSDRFLGLHCRVDRARFLHGLTATTTLLLLPPTSPPTSHISSAFSTKLDILREALQDIIACRIPLHDITRAYNMLTRELSSSASSSSGSSGGGTSGSSGGGTSGSGSDSKNSSFSPPPPMSSVSQSLPSSSSHSSSGAQPSLQISAEAARAIQLLPKEVLSLSSLILRDIFTSLKKTSASSSSSSSSSPSASSSVPDLTGLIKRVSDVYATNLRMLSASSSPPSCIDVEKFVCEIHERVVV